MVSKSSNKQMEKQFGLLSKIQTSEPSETLFDSIQHRVKSHNENTISLSWVRTVAAIFICFISIEIYTISENNNSEMSIEEIIPETNNMLYYE